MISASTVFYINLLTIKKLRLELDRLRTTHNEEQRLIVTATEKQIEKYGTGPRFFSGMKYFKAPPRQVPMGLIVSRNTWEGLLILSVIWLVVSFFTQRYSHTFRFLLGFSLFVAIYYFVTYGAFKYFFDPSLDTMRRVLNEHKLKLRNAAEQIVGPERG